MVGQVLDEFHPGGPDNEEVESHESVKAYIKKLQAEYDNFITSPRQFYLTIGQFARDFLQTFDFKWMN